LALKRGTFLAKLMALAGLTTSAGLIGGRDWPDERAIQFAFSTFC
jgi:hypothetical protein